MAELHEVCHPRDPDWIDDEGKLIQSDQGPFIAFGKHNGKLLKDIVESDPDYLGWLLSANFSQQLKEIVADALGNNG